MPQETKCATKRHRMRNTTKSPNMVKERAVHIGPYIPNYICRINPDLYSIRVTRRISKILYSLNNFSIIEVYKCMPLLGDEDNIPYWDVHVRGLFFQL